ncbi:MAG: GWxTD domain-containing protein [Calditrichaeota bacterium]|nr:MAG: GWxTD domain-containing protein [Calditrichota bacterium]
MFQISKKTLLPCLSFTAGLLLAHPFPGGAQTAAWDSVNTPAQYLALLATADQALFRRDFEIPFLLLLDAQQRQDYDGLASMEQRKEFIRFYWREPDPDPLLPQNDWLAEFIRRFKFVKAHFATAASPYFDDRGKYYLKYGEPQFRFVDEGGLKVMDYFTYQTLRRTYRVPPSQKYSVPPNESWGYEQVRREFVVHFVEEDSAFREIGSLGDILHSSSMKDNIWHWHDLMKQRASISPLMLETFLKSEDVVEQLDLSTLGVKSVRIDQSHPHEFVSREKLSEDLHEERAKQGLPSSAYRPVHAVNKIDFSEDISQFQGPEGRTRIEVTLRSPLHQYHLQDPKVDSIRIEYAGLLRDVGLKSVAQARSTLEIPRQRVNPKAFPDAVGNLVLLAPPAEDEVTFQVRDQVKDRVGFSKRNLAVRSFAGDSLMLSDIRLFTEVRSAAQRRFLPTLERQGLQVAPYPYANIRKQEPVYCYFEIYNLDTFDTGHDVTISLSVYRTREAGNLVQKLAGVFSRPGEEILSIQSVQPATEESGRQLLAVDLSKLENGVYILEVVVADAENTGIRVESHKKIVVGD